MNPACSDRSGRSATLVGMSANEWNDKIIAEFRANDGKVGGPFEGATIALITHTGAKTGTVRTTPLVCNLDGGDVIIIASKAGAPTHPHWYLNLIANPTATVELGTDKFEASVTEATGAERDRLYAAQAAIMPQFNDYVVGAGDRVIPVLRLTRK